MFHTVIFAHEIHGLQPFLFLLFAYLSQVAHYILGNKELNFQALAYSLASGPSLPLTHGFDMFVGGNVCNIVLIHTRLEYETLYPSYNPLHKMHYQHWL